MVFGNNDEFWDPTTEIINNKLYWCYTKRSKTFTGKSVYISDVPQGRFGVGIDSNSNTRFTRPN